MIDLCVNVNKTYIEYIQVHLKKLNVGEKYIFLVTYFKKWNFHIS